MFAPDKVGKTNSWMSILQRTTVNFWVGDSDRAFWDNLPEFDGIDTNRVHLYDSLYSWEDWIRFGEDALEGSKPDDWVVIDRADMLREAAQAYWTEEVEGSEVGDWYLKTEKELKEVNERRRARGRSELGIQTEINWQFVNNLYYNYLMKLHLRLRDQHMFICSSANQIITEGGWAEKDQRVLAKFGDVGMKPGGGKGLPAIPSTILFLNMYAGNRELTTIGDRGRERKFKLDKKKYVDFVVSYLMPVAGWKIVEDNEGEEE